MPLNYDDPNDEAAARDIAVRLARTRPFKIRIDPVTAWNVIATLQLALRHPQIPASTRAKVTRWLDDAIHQTAQGDPVLSRVLRRGFDPAADVPPDVRHDDAIPTRPEPRKDTQA